MGFFAGAHGRLHYRDRPVDGAVAGIALLPGSGQHSGHYHEFARQLNGAGLGVWTLDTAGQGLSEGDPERVVPLPQLVDDAARFIGVVRAQAPGLPLVLMGHSLGAVTALAALGAAGGETTDGGRREPRPGSVVAEPDPGFPAGLVLCGTPARVLGGPPATDPALPPVFAVHGVDDRRAPVAAVRAWAAQRDGVDLREYPGAGHDLLHERVRTRVTADIVQWTQEIVAGRR
ncbi:alpha/beta fold hydrolase [Nocardia sp. NPDC024068]|uniref:alpha/beta hydrolase n=1 Tax=Nocardia sp. NPDC024068 TaxID=3157197 RepID=UPI0033DD8FF3